MKFEILKKDNKKKIAIGIIAVISITLVGVFTSSFAKYQLTEDVPLVKGTINYKVPDMRVVAVNISEDGNTYTSTDDIPVSGYTFNETKSICKVYDGSTSIEEAPKDENITIEYQDGKINFLGVSKNNTRCYLYFDKIRDTEVPVVSKVEATEVTKTSIAIKVTASDNEGVTKYLYSINNGTYIEKATNTHTFSGLTKGTTYTISVKAKDAAGNESAVKTETIATDSGLAINTILSGITPNTTEPNFGSMAETDEGIFKAQDNDGTSYYWRGAVENNYLTFAGFWWRIIRINGDGTIRIIYDGTEYHANGTKTNDNIAVINQRFNALSSANSNNAYLGFQYTLGELRGSGTKSNALSQLEIWYDNNLQSYTNRIDTNAGFCGDRTAYTNKSGTVSGGGTGTTTTYYGAYVRLSGNSSLAKVSPVLICENSADLYTTKESAIGSKTLEKPIGLISADEIAMAGSGYGNNYFNSKYYLYNGNYYWTMSPSSFSEGSGSMLSIASYGHLQGSYPYSPNNIAGLRPVINLRADVPITGSGTGDDPFVVN